jgi:hypothetical protein
MLKMLVTFVAATILGALGQQVLGIYGMLLGSAAGAIIGWYVARKIVPR